MDISTRNHTRSHTNQTRSTIGAGHCPCLLIQGGNRTGCRNRSANALYRKQVRKMTKIEFVDKMVSLGVRYKHERCMEASSAHTPGMSS